MDIIPPDQVTQCCDSDQDNIAKCQFENVRYTHKSRHLVMQMSALGQKRTFAVQKGMSALPPKADIDRPEAWMPVVPSTGHGYARRNRRRRNIV